MSSETDASLVSTVWSEIVRRVRARTPARLLVSRVGAPYRTRTQLELREAHAAARDAVRAELNLETDLPSALVSQWKLFEVWSQAGSKDEYLLRPGFGRRFSDASRAALLRRCSSNNHLQIAIGDGLSITAVSAQVPALLPALYEGAKTRGWSVGQTFVILQITTYRSPSGTVCRLQPFRRRFLHCCPRSMREPRRADGLLARRLLFV